MTPPRPTVTDEQLRAVFAAHGAMDLDSNFFEAGFSSVILTRVLETLRGRALDVSLVDLYRYPTVRKLAAALRARQASPSSGGPTAPPWARPAGATGS